MGLIGRPYTYHPDKPATATERSRRYRAELAQKLAYARPSSKVYHRSQTTEWATPQALFDKLHAEFGFTLDVCATAENAKCARYFTKEDNGLKQPWDGVCWMNPPYGKATPDWIRKAYESAQQGATVVCLVPVRTDTKWWQTYVIGTAEVRFIAGRLKFGNAEDAAPFPNAVVIFRPR